MAGMHFDPVPLSPRGRVISVSLGFFLAYVALDWLSFAYPYQKLNITPWNPLAGLSLVWLWLGPKGGVGLVVAARILSNLFLRGHSDQIMDLVLTDLVVVLGYAILAHVLRRHVRLDGDSPNLLQVGRFTVICGLVLTLFAGLFVSALCVSGLLQWQFFAEACWRRSIGDFVGVLTLVPLIILVVSRGQSGQSLVPRFSWTMLAQAVSMVILLAVLFGIPEVDEFRFFYLLFLPMIWVAVTGGFPAAAVAILGTQIGLMLAIRLWGGMSGASVTAIQLLTICLTVTGLLLGAVVSERWATQGRLRASEGRVQAILAAVPDALLILDEHGGVQSWNSAGAALFGLGAPGSVLVWELLPDIRLEDENAGEMVARTATQPRLPVEVRVSSLRLDDEAIRIVMVRDISARRAMEAVLAEKQAELNRVSRFSATGELASAIAHEINQPLTAIINYAGVCRMLLNAQGDSRTLAAVVDKIALQSTRAGEIIRSLRRCFQSGKRRRTWERLPLVLDETLALMQPDIIQARVVVLAKDAQALPPVQIERIQIQQVAQNLVRNALDALAGRGGSITWEVAQAADQVIVTISDDGPGVPPHLVDGLFSPLKTDKPSGMGLGLSICKTIIENHGGRIWYARSDTGGAAFHFSLPLKQDDSDA